MTAVRRLMPQVGTEDRPFREALVVNEWGLQM